MYYALVDAFDRLVEVEARSKHLVLITDGKTTNNPRDYPGFLERLESQQDVTLTSIALGESPNFALLGTLVESGRGALYHVTDYLKLPQLTMQVTQRLSRSRFVAGDVDVVGTLAESSEIAIPPITGYVLTYPRTTARTLLWAGEDPLFATWRVGVGASSVLNTDLDGNWSQNWVSWAQASVLFEEMLAATEPLVASAAGLLPSIVIEPAETQLLVDARDESGAFGDFLKLEAAILPTENVFEVPQVAPGLYRVRFSTPAEGGYAVQLHDRTRGRTAIFSFTVPYPSEYRASGADRAMFETITRATGGAIVEGGTPLTSPSGAERIGHKPLFEILLLAALALFLIELILRKRPRRPRSLDSLRDAS
jgi:Ca-activated chloride channel family protein